ncbi:MAG: hypothetical protein RR877_00955 [Aurantimicrobium sp.]
MPIYGAFFSDSLVLFDKINKRRLNYGVDFCAAGLLQNETMSFGKSINSVVLILNREVSNNISITYQNLGGDYERNNAGLEAILKLKRPDNDNPVFNDIEKLPTTFKPTFHKHDFGDIYGMDYLVFLLERLRMAVIWKKVEMVITVIEYINDFLNQLSLDAIIKADDTFDSLLINFKAAFNKITYGLGLIKNQGLITVEEAKAIFNDEYFDKVNEGYLSITGLLALRDELYSSAVSTKLTNLGKSHGTYILPTLTALSGVVVGSVFILNSYAANSLDSVQMNAAIYPDINRKDTRWSLKKMSGKVTEVGGMFLATALNDNSTFIGRLRVNSLNELFIEWKALLNSLNLDFLVDLEDHLKDKTNPHRDHKSRLKLGNVENLPVATREEIVCNIPARSYITFENLMLYMKRFQTGEKNVRDIDLQESEANTKRRMQAIFSPCGPCNTNKDEWNLIDECMVVAPPEKVPNAIYETDRNLVTNEADFATLTSYLEDFRPSQEVTIKIYRRVVDYQVPTPPPPVTDPPPPVAKYYFATWTGCENNEPYCLDAYMTLPVGDSTKIPVPTAALRTGVVKSDIGDVIHAGVSWEMQTEEFEYISSSAKQLVRKLTEANSKYDVTGAVISIQPGVMDDFAIRGLYKEVPFITAVRRLTFVGSYQGKVVGTMNYVQEIKIDVL